MMNQTDELAQIDELIRELPELNARVAELRKRIPSEIFGPTARSLADRTLVFSMISLAAGAVGSIDPALNFGGFQINISNVALVQAAIALATFYNVALMCVICPAEKMRWNAAHDEETKWLRQTVGKLKNLANAIPHKLLDYGAKTLAAIDRGAALTCDENGIPLALKRECERLNSLLSGIMLITQAAAKENNRIIKSANRQWWLLFATPVFLGFASSGICAYAAALQFIGIHQMDVHCALNSFC